VALGERPLDPLLALEQPVHRREQLGLFDLAQRELAGERRLPKAARRRELGARADQALADHRHDQVALAAALARDQPLKVELAQDAQDRGDVAVGQRALDRQRLVEVDQLAPREHRPDRVDHIGRQVREVAEVLVADLAGLAVGAAQQVRGIHATALALRLDCGYVN